MSKYSRTEERCSFERALPGKRGTRIDQEPASNISGSDGSITVVSGIDAGSRTTIRRQLSHSKSLLYLETALREAEASYANADYATALDQLQWLGELVVVPAVCQSSRGCAQDFGQPDEPLEAASEFDAVRTKIFVLLRRMAAGFDFFGNTENFVPLLGRSFYANVVERMLDASRVVEAAYIKYRDARDNWAQQRVEIGRGLDGQTIVLAVLRERTGRLSLVETALVKDINLLSSAYDGAWRRVQSAGDAFKGAVKRQSGGCDFQEVVLAVATIATAVSTAGTGAAIALAAWKAYSQFDKQKEDPDDKLGDLAPVKYKVEKIAAVGKGVSGIATGLAEIADVLNRPSRPDLPDLPSDAGKVLMHRSDLHETVDPFRHLPEAREYLRVVDDFIELVTTRNNKLIEYNALSNSRAEILSEETKAQSEITRLRVALANPNVQHLPEFASFMARANVQNKRVLVQMLYHEHRALEYWAGSTYSFSVVQDSIDHLSQTHIRQLSAMVEAMENRGRSPEEMRMSDGVAKFSLKDDVGEFALQDFVKSGKVVFSLPMDRFEGLALVRFSAVRIALPGIKWKENERGVDSIGLQLIHFGQAILTTLENTVAEFSHEPRATHIFYTSGSSVTREFSLGGDGDTFIKLAGNGPWSLTIAAADEERVELSGVADVVLEFAGEFFSLRTLAPMAERLLAVRRGEPGISAIHE